MAFCKDEETVPEFIAVAVYLTSLLVKTQVALTLRQGRWIAIFARLGAFVLVAYLICSTERVSASQNIRLHIRPFRQTARVKFYVFNSSAKNPRNVATPPNVYVGGSSFAAVLLGCVYEFPMTVLPSWLRHKLVRYVPVVPPFELLHPS
jgi:hypothetical protein